jgi:hypothetical protein
MTTDVCASCGANVTPGEDGSCPSCHATAVQGAPSLSSSDEPEITAAQSRPKSKSRGLAKRGFYGIVGVALFASGILSGLAAIALLLRSRGMGGPRESFTDSLIMSLAGVILGLISAGALHWGRILCNAARRSLADDEIPKVILFRSFQDDARSFPRFDHDLLRPLPLDDDSFEATLLKECSPLGTRGAIGNPREKLPPTGAIRGYFSDDTWKAQAIRYIDGCENIVVILGPTENLAWELEQIVKRKAAKKLLLVMPPHLSAKFLWDRFREAHGRIAATPLPEEISDDTLVIRFDEAWNPSFYGARNKGGDDYAVCMGQAVRDIKKGRFTKGLVRARPPIRVISVIGAILTFILAGFFTLIIAGSLIFEPSRGLLPRAVGCLVVLVGALMGGWLGYRIKR